MKAAALLTSAATLGAQEPAVVDAPGIRLQLVSPDGAPVTDMLVTVDTSAARDSVIVRVEPLSDTSRFHPARIAFVPSRLEFPVLIAVVPRVWRIATGSFAGREVAIDPAAALRRAPHGGSFGRLRADRVVGWNPHEFPIPLLLARTHGVTRGDSLAFWSAVREVERALGGVFFRAASDSEFTGSIYPPVVRIDPRLDAEGLTFVSWNGDGDIYDGSTAFRRVADLSDPSIVAHELLHLLGFGHTNAWPSALAAAPSRLLGVTAADAAYAQLLLRLRELQVDRGTVGGLASAIAGRR